MAVVLFFVITIQVAAIGKEGQQSDLVLSISRRVKEDLVTMERPSLLLTSE